MPSFGKNKTGVDSGEIDVQLFLADARNLFTTIGIWENDNTKDVVPKMTMLSSKLEEIQDMRRYVRENFNNPATHAYLREAEGFVSEVSRLIKDMRDLREIVHSNTENMNLIFSRIERQSNSQDVLNGLAKEFYRCVAHIMAAYHEMRDISNEEYKVPDDSVLIGRARGFEPVVANKLAEINGKVTEMDVEIGKVVDRVSKKKSEFTDAIDAALKYKLRVETVYEKNRDRDILCATVDNYVKDARKSVNSLDTEISKCKVKYGAMSNLRSIFAKYTPDNIAGINDRSVHIVRRCVTMTSEITQILVDVDKIHCLKFKVDNDLKNKLIRIKRGREEEEKEGEEKEGEEKEGEEEKEEEEKEGERTLLLDQIQQTMTTWTKYYEVTTDDLNQLQYSYGHTLRSIEGCMDEVRKAEDSKPNKQTVLDELQRCYDVYEQKLTRCHDGLFHRNNTMYNEASRIRDENVSIDKLRTYVEEFSALCTTMMTETTNELNSNKYDNQDEYKKIDNIGEFVERLKKPVKVSPETPPETPPKAPPVPQKNVAQRFIGGALGMIGLGSSD